MKKNLNYFNKEERSGLMLLMFVLLLFSTFIFLQKRVLPSNSTINVSHATLEGSSFASTQQENGRKKGFPKQAASVSTKALSSPQFDKVASYDQEINALANTKPKAQQISYEKARIKTKVQRKVNNFVAHVSADKKKSAYQSRKKTNPVSINSQDPLEWEELYGIGPKYAGRIIKYQKWLGGFHSKEQIKEVYGINDTIYQDIEPYLLPSKPYQLIKVNTAEVKDLGRHPYLDWKQAKMIINYRKHHGAYKDQNDLLKLKGMNEKSINKILPYLDFSVLTDADKT